MILEGCLELHLFGFGASAIAWEDMYDLQNVHSVNVLFFVGEELFTIKLIELGHKERNRQCDVTSVKVKTLNQA